ncbi:MAG: hypothetical protein ACYC7D_05130 [Nitrososphaerales archaeon]
MNEDRLARMAVENLKKIRERLKPDHMIMVGDRSAIDGEDKRTCFVCSR